MTSEDKFLSSILNQNEDFEEEDFEEEEEEEEETEEEEGFGKDEEY